MRPELDALSAMAQTNDKDDSGLPITSQLFVIRRDKTTIPFDAERISNAIARAYQAEYGDAVIYTYHYSRIIKEVTEAVVEVLNSRYSTGGNINIEEIQDQVVLNLFLKDQEAIARRYKQYRESRAIERANRALVSGQELPEISLVYEDGSEHALNWNEIHRVVDEACSNLQHVESRQIVAGLIDAIHDKMPAVQLPEALVSVAEANIQVEPNYRFVGARLLLARIRREVAQELDLQGTDGPVLLSEQRDLETAYAAVFAHAIEHGIEAGLIDPRLREFDLDLLGNALNHEFDFKFARLGLQTLYDRYLLHKDGNVFELPQVLFMRVAMGLALNEENKVAKAIEFYHQLAQHDFMSSTPTLFNSGTTHAQLSSCYLSTVPDDLEGIFNAYMQDALLAKWAGGLGNDWTRVRAADARIKGTNGLSNGVIPFVKLVNDLAVAVNQGGKRDGAACVYLETWHRDIESFLALRKNTGEERLRTPDINTANWIPDLFMKRVEKNADWTLFSPDDVPDLHDAWGAEFEKRYLDYEARAERGEIQLYKQVNATELWREMLRSLYETAHPWMTFKDAANIRSPQRHTGVIHSSNLCTEITLNTSDDEIAVCNLGSINLANHVDDQGNVLTDKLRETIRTAIEMLDNVIDINFYAVDEAKTSNLRHRPIGLGIMGFQDALIKKRISYASAEAVEFADQSMELISYYAIEASSDLAATRGSYESYEGSLWHQGILPIDSVNLLKEERRLLQDSDDTDDCYCEVDTSYRLDWEALREKIAVQGMRNSNVLAIAPTATIANIVGVTASIEPLYTNYFAKENKSGVFQLVNEHLVRDLKSRGYWTPELIQQLSSTEGMLGSLDLPKDLKDLYLTAYEIDPRWLLLCASRRQKWIDQSQSLNLYFATFDGKRISGKKLDLVYRNAWKLGLKTTYYCRTREASSIERADLDVSDNRLTVVSSSREAALDVASVAPARSNESVADFALGESADNSDVACLLDDPDCESCAG